MSLNHIRTAGLVVVLGLIVASFAYLIVYGDGNSPATYTEGDIHTVRLCESSPRTAGHFELAREQWAKRCWPEFDIETEICSQAPLQGYAFVRGCGDIIDGEGSCDGDFHGKDEALGYAKPVIVKGKLIASTIWLRSKFEAKLDTTIHEVGHGVYGLGLPHGDGTDGHDQHASRRMGRAHGLSWAGLDRCDGGDFEWIPRDDSD